MFRITLFALLAVATLIGCTSTPPHRPVEQAISVPGKTVCDSYIILSMCVQDLVGDGTVDMVYFTDTNEVFMYQQGRYPVIAQVMPFHRCAVPLNEGMQNTTNRILKREDLSLAEELDITRHLITNYVAAKPSIDACNAQFADENSHDPAQEDEFFVDDSDWDVDS